MTKDAIHHMSRLVEDCSLVGPAELLLDAEPFFGFVKGLNWPCWGPWDGAVPRDSPQTWAKTGLSRIFPLVGARLTTH